MAGWIGTSEIGKTGALLTDWSILDPLITMRSPGGAEMMLPLQMCCEGSKWDEEDGARLLFHSMVKNLKVRHTCMEVPRHPRLVVSRHRW